MRFRQLLWRSLRLRCPVCGKGKLFRGFLRMHETCSSCGTRFEREPGFFLGSIYFNYGLTALLVAAGYPILLFSGSVDEQVLLWSAAAFTLVFPILFFRYARSLWLGFDQFMDPRPESNRTESK
jgi:uncharacterized protein (DUF983 family)